MAPIVSVRDLSGGYGAGEVISGISFDVRKGQFLGVIGPNGSGKSTMLRLMTRVIEMDKGSVALEGREIAKIGSKPFARKVAFVPQDTAINFPFSVWDIVMMGRIPHLGRLQPETERDIAVSKRSLEAVDALEIRDKKIDSLSAGERQRVIIARALAQEPLILFLDEPTSHLDIGHQVMTLDLLRKLNNKNGLTVIIVLHDLNLASEYCDSLIMLDRGKIFAQGAPEEVLTYQNIEKVYKTVVVVKKNPFSSKPYVILVSEKELCGRA